MMSVQTPFGPLVIHEEERTVEASTLVAEMKGLQLLHDIACLSDAWVIKPGRTRDLIESVDYGPCITIDPLLTVANHLQHGDGHFVMKMGKDWACVLAKKNAMKCAIADGLISVVLLGIAGWPVDETPHTLQTKAKAVRLHHRLEQDKETVGEYSIPMSYEEILEFWELNHRLRTQEPMTRLREIGAYARRLYVCLGHDQVNVQHHVQCMMEGITPEEIAAYVQNPAEPCDALFLNVQTAC